MYFTLISCVCFLVGQALSFNYGDILAKEGVSNQKLHTFEILMPSSVLAQQAAQDIFKSGSHKSYLTVNFLRSRFCLGHNVILEVTTDDNEKLFGKTVQPTDERPEVLWVKDALSSKLFEDVVSVTYHSYHSAFYDASNKEKINLRCIFKCALKCGPDPSCIVPCVTGCFQDSEKKQDKLPY